MSEFGEMHKQERPDVELFENKGYNTVLLAAPRAPHGRLEDGVHALLVDREGGDGAPPHRLGVAAIAAVRELSRPRISFS